MRVCYMYIHPLHEALRIQEEFPLLIRFAVMQEVLIKKVADQKEENVVILHNKDVDRAKLEPV